MSCHRGAGAIAAGAVAAGAGLERGVDRAWLVGAGLAQDRASDRSSQKSFSNY